MSAADVAHQIRSSLPGTEEIIVDYLSGYLVDEAAEDEDVLHITRNMLVPFARDRPDALEDLLVKLGRVLETRISARERLRGPKLVKLEKAMEMGKTGAMSNTIALSEGVDLESINKAKCVLRYYDFVLSWNVWIYRASRVDMKKLEKQETKLRVRMSHVKFISH